MAIGSSVPPRAYTREILTTAFNWLQSQPDSVRTKATTPDALVALYMQAQRGGAPAVGFDSEAPVSSQVFMSDLKNLAKGLEEFGDSRDMKASPPPASSRAQLGDAPTYPHSARAFKPPGPTAAVPHQGVAPKASSMASSVAASAASSMGAGAVSASRQLPLEDFTTEMKPHVTGPSTVLIDGLNERSLQMFQEVQTAMNLTSEVEALNLMIAMAHRSLKSLLA